MNILHSIIRTKNLLQTQSRIDYQLEDKFDLVLFFSAFILIIIGLAAVYSSTVNHPVAGGNFYKQLFWAVASMIIFFITYFIQPRTFYLISIPAYLFSLMALIAVVFVGKTVYGARSWIDFGPVGFQPSEFAKVGTLLFLASYLSREKTDMDSIKDIFTAMFIGFIPIVLILLEPDMGTALIFASLTLILLFWKGISLFGIFCVISPGLTIFASMFGTITFILVLLLIIGALFFFKKNLFLNASIFVLNLASGFFFDAVYGSLSPHQQKRIASFLDPNADPLGSGYNAIQAKVAIGSGGFFGKGFLNGNQTQLRFIPEQWTDFIFCVIGEEFGFIGSIVTVSLFLFLFLRLLKISSLAKDKNEFNSIVVIGILTIMFVHFAINVGMTIGLMPVIGVPLPFLSYGGSSLMVNMFLLGIAANIYRNRKQHA